MKDFVLYILNYLVDNKDALSVKEEETGPNFTNIIVSADQSEYGKIIGKNGKIIKSIRILLRVLALKQQKKVNLVLQEP